MKRIMLVCSAGMSTSMLVTKMEAAAKDSGVETKIWAVATTQAKEEWENADVILLGPQVRFMKNEIETMVKGSIPVEVIDMAAYGAMNGAAVLDKALSLIQ